MLISISTPRELVVVAIKNVIEVDHRHGQLTNVVQLPIMWKWSGGRLGLTRLSALEGTDGGVVAQKTEIHWAVLCRALTWSAWAYLRYSVGCHLLRTLDALCDSERR